MKILLLNYEFPPLGGGAGNATYYLLKEFAKDKESKIDLVTASVNKYREENFSPNVKIYYLGIGKKGSLHFQSKRELLFYSLRAYFFCQKLISKNKYDLVHAFFGIPCGYVAMKLGLPYIVSLRGSDVPFYNKRFYWLDRFVFKRLSRRVWSYSRAVIALSYDLAEIARKTSETQKITVIYNGINTEQFQPSRDVSTEERIFNLLFVGRLIERKGLIYLLKAFFSLEGEYSNIRLHVVGDGPLFSKYYSLVCRRRIDSKVIFYKRVFHDKINKLYQKSHIFISPSLNEALGNVVQEAMATGLPVITTNTGAAELLKGNGFVVEKGSDEALRKAVVKYLKNPELMLAHGIKSRKIAEQMSWKNVAQKYKNIYGKTI